MLLGARRTPEAEGATLQLKLDLQLVGKVPAPKPPSTQVMVMDGSLRPRVVLM